MLLLSAQCRPILVKIPVGRTDELLGVPAFHSDTPVQPPDVGTEACSCISCHRAADPPRLALKTQLCRVLPTSAKPNNSSKQNQRNASRLR
ncbi:hypothetical protein ACJRO7_000353 [Eucalyptus globulus]|uniref:Uncharacterized protein n=1 Tax=Eucalyptus globulus TaxID=34317 RepID=A0ABD3LNC2_EUCGL